MELGAEKGNCAAPLFRQESTHNHHGSCIGGLCWWWSPGRLHFFWKTSLQFNGIHYAASSRQSLQFLDENAMMLLPESIMSNLFWFGWNSRLSKLGQMMEAAMEFGASQDMSAVLAVQIRRRLGLGIWTSFHISNVHLEGKVLNSFEVNNNCCKIYRDPFQDSLGNSPSI